MWIDTHCHPFAKPFNSDRAEIIQAALDADVKKMIVVGFNQETNRQALALAEEHDFMWATLGVHPCDCEELTEEELSWMQEMAAQPRVIAIGEMGLDYHHMSYSKEVQEDCFRKQIRLANALDLPCIVHSRDAAEDTLRILKEEAAKKVIFHCYSYGLEFGRKVWAEGYYTSFSGVLTYPQAKDIQDAAKHAPIDQILIETDCPYLAPQSIRGKRNEMAFVSEVGAFLAELRAVPANELQGHLAQNVARLFDI